MSSSRRDLAFPNPFARRCWSPAADVYRTQRGWLVKVELAGVQPTDVQLECRGSTLIISGQRRDVMLDICQCCQSLEISYDSFERHIDLGTPLSGLLLATEFQSGMLLIHLTMPED